MLNLAGGLLTAGVIFFITVMVVLFTIAGLWKKITKAVILFGVGWIYNGLAGLWEFAKTLETEALKNAFVLPVRYWDSWIPKNAWVGVSGIIIWYVVCISVISDILLSGFKDKAPVLRKKKYWFSISALFSWLPLLMLGGGLPNFRQLFATRVLAALGKLIYIFRFKLYLISFSLIGFGILYMVVRVSRPMVNEEKERDYGKDLLKSLPKVDKKLVKSLSTGKKIRTETLESLKKQLKDMTISMSGRHLNYMKKNERGEIFKTPPDFKVIFEGKG